LAERKVLVVDDELNIVKVVTRILEAVGYQVLAARSAAEGMTLIRRHGPVDCALLDYSLEGESCSEAWVALSLAQPGLKVVIQSGFAHAEVEAGLPELPLCAGYLKKPFGMEQLITAVAAACSGSAGQKCTSVNPSGGLGLDRVGSTSP
jgi:DNA-binding NtrC family response regulator